MSGGVRILQSIAVAIALTFPSTACMAAAQSVTIVAGVKTLSSPTAAVYSGTSSVPTVSVSGGFDCKNGNAFSAGCSLLMRVAAAGSQVIEARLLSLSGAASCARAATFTSSSAWIVVPTSDVPVFTSDDRKHDCTGTLEFRTTNISWTVQTSTGSSPTNYDRDVVFTAIKN